ncbi:putative Phosphate transport system permease protein PstC [uncultured Eubacteriales bacterium]|uniref:Phosphate transport system permease protein n=1 Tax=uncultured Eubacteriales bacterium TaxID=172733 RepID=A0A212KAB9_9FIRM|nr:putative Phosphate transport system permease protein PstC [uncultured Eubacteriales bacterium]
MTKKKWNIGLPEAVIYLLSAASIAVIVFIFLFVFYKAFPVLRASGLSLFTSGGFDKQIQDAFYSSEADPVLSFGILGLISGTVITTTLALLLASAIGIGSAIIICEYSSRRVSGILISVVRLLASVPSVVFGLIGIVTVVPLMEELFVTVDRQIEYLDFFQMSGRNLLSASIVLTFMIAPTVVSLSVDAIRAVPHLYKETGYAFGMSKFRVIWKIILPGARSGIMAGIVLAAGRGMGEAIAVSMVCGGIGFLPKASLGFINFLAPTLPLAAAIINKSEAMGSFAVESALFTCGAVLLLIGAALSIGAKSIEKKMRRSAGHDD